MLFRSKFMGLKLPRINLQLKPLEPPDSISWTTASYDTAKEHSRQAVEVLSKYAVATKEMILLSRELKKVQRRVNALEKMFIPPHEEAKKFIADRIEELEREEVFAKKLIRQRHV